MGDDRAIFQKVRIASIQGLREEEEASPLQPISLAQTSIGTREREPSP